MATMKLLAEIRDMAFADEVDNEVPPEKISDRSKVGKRKTTNRPRLQSAAAAKVDQRPSKSLWLR